MNCRKKCARGFYRQTGRSGPATLAALLVPITVLIALPLAAAPDILDSPIDLEADRATLDSKARTATYEGSVVITQGEQRLSGDLLTISYSDDNKIAKAVLRGTPAVYDRDDGDTRGSAEKIVYDPDAGVVSLHGDASFKWGEATFSSSMITYDIRKGVVDAVAEEDDKVRFRLPPE